MHVEVHFPLQLARYPKEHCFVSTFPGIAPFVQLTDFEHSDESWVHSIDRGKKPEHSMHETVALWTAGTPTEDRQYGAHIHACDSHYFNFKGHISQVAAVVGTSAAYLRSKTGHSERDSTVMRRLTTGIRTEKCVAK